MLGGAMMGWFNVSQEIRASVSAAQLPASHNSLARLLRKHRAREEFNFKNDRLFMRWLVGFAFVLLVEVFFLERLFMPAPGHGVFRRSVGRRAGEAA
jgi:hypothetical protein